MSKNVSYQMRSLRDREILLAALAELGYSGNRIEVHETATHLYGISGDKRAETAHIVIRRQHTGIGASNDIGFLQNADGTFTAIVSEYDRRHLLIKGKTFTEAVSNAYGKINANKTVQTLLHTTIPKMKLKGLIPRHATIQRVQNVEQQKTEYVVRY